MKKIIGLIWSIVKRFYGRGYEKEDLYQIGTIGFIKAIKRFNTDFEVKISTYAVPYILGEIKRFIRDDGPIKVSRSIKMLNVKIKELQKEYLNKYGEEITINKISTELKISKEEIVMALESNKNIDSLEDVSYKNNNTDKTISIIEKLSTGKNEEAIIIDKLLVQSLIKELNEKEKQVILLRYYKEKTQVEVGKILGMTQVQVSRIEKKILNSMKEKLVS